DVPLHGFALQCRVTTEDPANNFTPDYGKIHTYRSPAGFGIRLDGASAYGGAVITPYYDSLLVKVTAWGNTFAVACQRMDRALREFRIRGVITNIPFLENVVNHSQFQAGEATTRFLDETPELFQFSPRQDRATKLLTYIGDVIVNGNKEVGGKTRPEALRHPVIPPVNAATPPPGTRQLLLELGPEAFAQWTRQQSRLLFTDTTFRDAHQSLFATRMRSYDMEAIANFVAHRMSGLYSLEMWGGATFDVALRFLHEDPWQRLARLRRTIPNICFQMLLRASNAVGYTAYPDNVVDAFIQLSAREGIDIFRIFDSLNWLPNMQAPMDSVRKTHAICEAAICYTGDILDPKREKYSLKYYVRMAKELERMGAHVLAIKDMAGLCRPYAAERLVQTLREEVGLPIHFHTHDISGVNAASLLKASDAGVDIVDGAIASMSGTTSQPNLNALSAALENTARASGLDVESLDALESYWADVRGYYAAFDNGPASGSGTVYLYEMPGGQYTNLQEQAESMGLGAKWRDVARMYSAVNMAFGDIVKVTPSSKVVGDMALFLVSHGMTMEQFLALPSDHNVTWPNSVVDMFMGSLGEPPGGWPRRVQQIILKGTEPRSGRPGELLTPVDFTTVRQDVQAQVGHELSETDLMSYLMYPEVFLKFEADRQLWSDVSVLPTPMFYYGMERGEETAIEIEEGKTLIVRFLTIGEPHPDGTRTVFYELNGQPREVSVVDRALTVEIRQRAKADPAQPGQVPAPIPGAVSTIFVRQGEKISRGDRLLVMEAMKMQTTVHAPTSGTVTELLVSTGQTVETKDLLLVISPPAS
ncbi:MAG: pyruvate carboxylase, partial [Bryobacteraceae bacterium]|nr:pyruvate carboxylase [Bryobacteraceae bacterium]